MIDDTKLLEYHVLPKEENCSLIFLRQILNGKKKILVSGKENAVAIPRYKEFTLNRLLLQFKDDAEVLSYLPDAGSQARAIDREFAYKIVAGLRPEYFQHILTEAISQRNIQPKFLKPETKLRITEDYIKTLLEKPWISSKLIFKLFNSLINYFMQRNEAES